MPCDVPQPYATVPAVADRTSLIYCRFLQDRICRDSRIRTALVSLLAIALFGVVPRHANLADVWAPGASGRRADCCSSAVLFVVLTYRGARSPLAGTSARAARADTVSARCFARRSSGLRRSALLPARAGDVLRPYLLARQEGSPTPATFATVVMERVLDLVAVLVLLARLCLVFGGMRDCRRACWRPIEVSAAIAAGVSVVAAGRHVGAGHASGAHRHARGVPRLASCRSRCVAASSADSAQHVQRRVRRGARVRAALLVALVWSFPLWLTIARRGLGR